MTRSLWLMPIALSLGLPVPLEASPSGCVPAKPGRYVVMGQGRKGDTPVAQLSQERWHPDGRIEGIRFQRSGRAFKRVNYSGSYQAESDCQVSIRRTIGTTTTRAMAVLTPGGTPLYSLSLTPNLILSSRWFAQGNEVCQAADLDGVVLSRQQGLSWDAGRWAANTVVQREIWRNGIVQGVALSNYAGENAQASYSGTLQLQADCLAQLTETDSRGVQYNYSSVLLTGGRGYVYLQKDPDDLTLGLLEHAER